MEAISTPWRERPRVRAPSTTVIVFQTDDDAPLRFRGSFEFEFLPRNGDTMWIPGEGPWRDHLMVLHLEHFPTAAGTSEAPLSRVIAKKIGQDF